MAGKGKGSPRKAGRTKGSATVTGAARAGTVFAPARFTRYLRAKRVAERVSALAGVFMAGALEYVVEELLASAGDHCLEMNKKTIKPQHLQLAISGDDELMKMCHQIHIADGGQPKDRSGTMAMLWPKSKYANPTGADGATQEK